MATISATHRITLTRAEVKEALISFINKGTHGVNVPTVACGAGGARMDFLLHEDETNDQTPGKNIVTLQWESSV